MEVWRLEGGQKPQLIRKHLDFESGLAYSQNGKLLAFIAKDGSIQVWDETTGAKKQRFIQA